MGCPVIVQNGMVHLTDTGPNNPHSWPEKLLAKFIFKLRRPFFFGGAKTLILGCIK